MSDPLFGELQFKLVIESIQLQEHVVPRTGQNWLQVVFGKGDLTGKHGYFQTSVTLKIWKIEFQKRKSSLDTGMRKARDGSGTILCDWWFHSNSQYTGFEPGSTDPAVRGAPAVLLDDNLPKFGILEYQLHVRKTSWPSAVFWLFLVLRLTRSFPRLST